MSASIDICLPGIASRVKRAATSETRSAPLEITTNWTMVMMRKMTAPTTKLPNVLMMVPAALGSCAPLSRMQRVVVTLRARRKRVVKSSIDGNVENASARGR